MKSILNRIKMQELVDALSTLTFEEVTEENLRRLLPNRDLDTINQVDETIKDIDIDNYIFTIHKCKDGKHPKHWLRNFKKDNSMFLSDIVEVFLPIINDRNSEFLQADGVITYVDGELRLNIGFMVE